MRLQRLLTNFPSRKHGLITRTFQNVAATKPIEVNEPVDNHSFKTSQSLANALKPRDVVDQLNNFIIGQEDAKRAVAIALRNRWRRHQLSDDLRNEVIPKNILMIGPTGCGKTEIARRIAKLSQAPFIKVEATKYTEVGYHGKDVDQIIKDLLDVSISMTKKRLKEDIKATVGEAVEERLLEGLVGSHMSSVDKPTWRENLRRGDLEDRIIAVDIYSKANPRNFTIVEGLEGILGELKPFRQGGGGQRGRVERKKMKVSEARPIIEEQEIEKVIEDFDVNKEAIAAVEQNGIVFIDEIDKLVSTGDYRGSDASSEGVQKDLLPLIEGTTISTKYGNVNTDFILFIASGAFHSSKPSDLLAELQGRLPIRVTLKALTEEDYYRILTEPVNNLIRQNIEMLRSEQVELVFTDEAIREIAKVAAITNRTIENIGARRLHTILERVLEKISFEAPETPGKRIEITVDYVKERVGELLTATDLRKYII